MAAAKKKKKKAPQETPQKAVALTWEELLVEKALAMITETDRQINESAGRFEQRMKEKNRQINESAELYEQQMKESAEQAGVEANEIEEQAEHETKRKGKKTGRRIKGSAEQPGQIDSFDRFYEDPAKNIDSPNLTRKYNELGFVFDKSYKDAVINDKKNNIYIEIDITLESRDKVMIIKTITRPSTKDINEHIERMKKVRRYADLHGDKRKYFGGISGINFDNDEKTFAMKNGFYIIELSGKNYTITAPKGGYSPREW